ncbi:MAG TPA: hypothetical protein VNJ01_11535 [Bacteriovoracaceae bacterium]|nr:hypothetical protein [Bacteriovoracaceae bacterium]
MKKSSRDCFCALCRSPRKLRYSRRIASRQVIQIFVLAIVLTAATYPWLAWKGIMGLPVIWAIFESVHKSLYRKDLKCPFCGFDPTWYKKDVKFARKQVEEFLKKNPESPLFKRKNGEVPSSKYQN